MQFNNHGVPSPELPLEVIGLSGDGTDEPSKIEADETPTVVSQGPGSEPTIVSDTISTPDSIPTTRTETLSFLPKESRKTEVRNPSSLPTSESSVSASQSGDEAVHRSVPNEGAEETSERARLKWQKQLFVDLNRYKRYPGGASQLSGEVTLTFVLDASGHIVSATVSKNSGEPALDKAALSMMLQSDPLPRPPSAVINEGLSFTIPVIFRSRKVRN